MHRYSTLTPPNVFATRVRGRALTSKTDLVKRGRTRQTSASLFSPPPPTGRTCGFERGHTGPGLCGRKSNEHPRDEPGRPVPRPKKAIGNAVATRCEAGTSNTGQHEREAVGTRDAAQRAPCINCCCKNDKQCAMTKRTLAPRTQRNELSIGKRNLLPITPHASFLFSVNQRQVWTRSGTGRRGIRDLTSVNPRQR